MQKLGMKPVPGVTRVTIKKSKNVRSLDHMCVVLLTCNELGGFLWQWVPGCTIHCWGMHQWCTCAAHT
jgi:hypothetical protein